MLCYALALTRVKHDELFSVGEELVGGGEKLTNKRALANMVRLERVGYQGHRMDARLCHAVVRCKGSLFTE